MRRRTPSRRPISQWIIPARLDSRQYGLFATDRIRFNDQWQTIIGGRQVRLDEKAYNEDGSDNRHTQRSMFLPQAALIYKPIDNVSLYTSYSKGLSLGGTAPVFDTNVGEILAPTLSRQLEAGMKYDWRRMSFTAAVFQTRQAYQYSRPNDDGSLTFVQQGQQKNTGLELSANGWLTSQLQIAASVAAIRARVEDSGTAAYEDHQAINVPKYSRQPVRRLQPADSGAGVVGRHAIQRQQIRQPRRLGEGRRLHRVQRRQSVQHEAGRL